jgi:hypothetical protein
MSAIVTPTSPSQKKWYEDDPAVIEEQKTQFSRAGVGFDAIQVKMQELYEIGVLKLFIESEIMKSNTGAFEPGFKELYKDLLFTSDIEFSESGFAPGSLENDKKKIFLNRSEFINYLLRLPKPISDTATTPLNENQDMNAYKYLQVLGSELQDKILFLCDKFIQGYNLQHRQNANDISRIQKEINDLKRLTGSSMSSDDIQKRIADKEKELVQVKNIKIQLETKRANYKNACTILSNSTRRSQYDASLLTAYPALKNDASSYSTVMLDWFKFKHNGTNFFKQVCGMYKPTIPNNMSVTRDKILISLEEIAAKLVNIFRPTFESYFFNKLTTNAPLRMVTNSTYVSYLFHLSDEVTRRSDPSKFSWININAMLSKIIKETQFTNHFDKVEFERMQSISQLMADFNSEFLTLFSLFKFEKTMNIFNSKPNDNKNVYERAKHDDEFFKRAENVNMLFQNVYYLKKILEMISKELERILKLKLKIAAIIAAQPKFDLITQLKTQLDGIVKTIDNDLFPILNVYHVNVQRYDYDTLLGAPSHSGFVENVFSGKLAFISHFHKNNKFLVSSEFIQNSPVTITIPDGNYTLETLSSVIENELCKICKWSGQSNYDAEMLWRCKYDNKNFLQLRLYFPINVFPSTYPNINETYKFHISSLILNPGVVRTIRLLHIPRGEYKNIRQVLDAMQETINDFITKPSEFIIIPLKSTFTITLELNTDPTVNAECIKFKLKKKSSNDPNEDLIIQLDTPLSTLFCRNPAAVMVYLNSGVDDQNFLPQSPLIIHENSEKILMEPPNELQLSKTITIDTATKIDGEVYDVSDIFGIRHEANESVQLYPDIVVTDLYVSNNYDKGSRVCNDRQQNTNFQSCIFLSNILNSQLELAGKNIVKVKSLDEFRILDFTNKRINNELTFTPVNMKEIEKNANVTASSTVSSKNRFKNEILEKTGIYMNNRRLLNPKVPVITPVDILNSILYRYPCIPSSHVKRILKEGSLEFDEFIQQRVNVPDFNAVVCLGKGEKGQALSLTFKTILKKSLMYDESDDRRNKLFCDLHYALCGPVYVDVNPSREINQLTILDQFPLQNNRPIVIEYGNTPHIKDPFTVKGITPYYDYVKEYYKYLIYGEYTEYTSTGGSYTRGCIKYYDPGKMVGPDHNLNASELYDVIATLSMKDGSIASSTIHKVVWLPSNLEHNVDKFIIVGEFQEIFYLNKYELPVEKNNRFAPLTQYYTIWSFSHEYPTPHSPSAPSYFETIDEIERIEYRRYRESISNVLTIYKISLPFIVFTYNVVITTNAEGKIFIYIPYNYNGTVFPNQVTKDRKIEEYYKLSCSATSMNKSLTKILNSYRFYSVMQNKYNNKPAINAYAISKIDTYKREFVYLRIQNEHIDDHLLWLGFKEKTTARNILLCSRVANTIQTSELVLPITFEDGDSIENIRVDINDPEIVTVFGKFKATVSDVTGKSKRPNKIIQNVMVIYTNLQNEKQNDSTYGGPAYSLGYDNFKGISINENEEFASFYSCTDGLVPASIDKGTMQQNIGILTVKKTKTSEPVIIGFHNAALTTMSDKSTVKEGAIHVPFSLCYDYNMCADGLKIMYNEFAYPPLPPETKIERSVFNPVTFYTCYSEGVGASNQNHSLSKGVYALIHAKDPSQLFSSPSNLHVLNTWGIDLSSNETLFYKRLYEAGRTSAVLQFNMKAYEKYMNDIVDTILGSAKAYYEDKIKSTFYTYGTIDGKPPIVFKRDGSTNRNIILGGGKEEDATQMLLATQYVADEDAQKSDIKNRKSVTRKKIIEIRIPDIMLSDHYVGVLTEPNRKNARMIFVNSVFKYSKQLADMMVKQNENVQKNKGADNNVVILDDYRVVLCSNNETIRNRFNELKAIDAYSSADYLTLSGDVFDFELPSSSYNQDKQVIIVNEWNDRGFIGDYGAYAYSDAAAAAATTQLTPNQTIISESMQMITEATAVKEAVTKSVPKYPNTAFLLNPVFSYHTLDPSKWTGINSLMMVGQADGGQVGGQVGGVFPRSSYGLPGLQQAQIATFNPYEYGLQQGYIQPPGPRDYNGYAFGDTGDEVVRMKRKVLESTDVPSTNLKKINFQTMQTDTRFKKIVLWLFDSRENKMLMVKTLIGNKVVVSLPVQNQQVGTVRASGYSLLQQLCRRLFNQADVIQKWTLEVSYAYNDDANAGTNGATGIFIYSAKSYDLPRPTLELIYVNMQAVLNLTKGSMIVKKGSQQTDESQLEINSRDVALVGEVFRVVPLIQGGIISSTSKEFNQIVANLVSKTPHQHTRSSISEKKRGENVEKNIQFLINLFFSQNSVFFVRGRLKYYIYSSQRSCKIFTIVKQPNYDDDSYLTCLKLFLQSEYDYKQKLSTFRVGCSMKKKLIADNFSNVWDSFWNDLIESEEQAKGVKQIESEIGSMETGEEGEEEEGEGEEQKQQVSNDDRVSAPVCLNGAVTTCKKMYELKEDWNISSYYPLAYDGISYMLDPSENPYGFNNEYYYNLENLATNDDGRRFYGFKCMKYNGDAKNPILYLGGKITHGGGIKSALYEMSLLTKNIKPMILTNVNSEILCIDMVGNKHVIIGGKGLNSMTKYIDGSPSDDAPTKTKAPLVIVNLETYHVTVFDPEPSIVGTTPDDARINKVCICKNRRVIDETQKTSYYEYVGLFGGDIKINTGASGAEPNIVNIGCVVIKVPIDDSNPNFQLSARMYCIDSNVKDGVGAVDGVIPGLSLNSLPKAQRVSVTSIICNEEEEEENEKTEQEDGGGADAGAETSMSNKTTFYVGGYFNAFGYVDYVGFQQAKAAEAAKPTGAPPQLPILFIKRGMCNSILKLSITTNYDTVKTDYRQECIFEPIETNANKNNIVFNASLALYKKDSSSQPFLLAFTAFVNQTSNPASVNLDASIVTTTLNVFDLKTKLNTQVMIPFSKSHSGKGNITKANYHHQCIALVQDAPSKKYVATMSYTMLEWTYSFTCELNMGATLRVIESKCNDETVTSRNNSVTDMCGIDNRNGNQIDIYVAHENIIVEADRPEDQILYPLTVRSNYQQVGNWNLGFINGESESESETKIFFRFIDSIIELNKIFKEYPSIMLFLQNVDYREKNQKITSSVLQKMYFDLESKTTLDDKATNIRDKLINLQYSCNYMFTTLNTILQVWNVATSAINYHDTTNVNLFNQIKAFYDSLIFLLIYAGCVTLAQQLCDNYVNLVLSNANDGEGGELSEDTWKEKFLNTFKTFDTNSTFKPFLNEKVTSINALSNEMFNMMICSNPETYTGVAFMRRRIDKNLNTSTSETKQKALQNKIYKSNETFFDANNDFFTTILASDSINTVDQINFCSFYKFQRLQTGGAPFITNFGGMMDATIYASVNIDSSKNFESSNVFEFLKVIVAYFKRLPSGSPVVETGIGGPIQRIIFGGNFGCNLLRDAQVCAQFAKNGMKVYTMPNNSNAITSVANKSGNQMFVVDANLSSSYSSSSSSSSGGGKEGGEIKAVEGIKQRIKIGEPIHENVKSIIVNPKKKTRRRYNF